MAMLVSDQLQQFTVSVPVTIRLCRKDDLPALEWFGMFTDHREMILAAYDSQERGEALMLVAETQGFPVCQVWIDLTLERVDATGVLWAVRVFPTLQNRGIGTRLMVAAEDVLRCRGCTAVELVSPQKSGAESPCPSGLPRRRNAGIMTRNMHNFSPLEPAALCSKTLTCTASQMHRHANSSGDYSTCWKT